MIYNRLGTEGFMPLEQVLKANYQTEKVDIWSIGVILLEFLTSKHTIFKNLRIRKEKNSPEILEYAFGYIYELCCIFGTKEVKAAARLYGKI
jgi:Serine/threonine protein kinase